MSNALFTGRVPDDQKLADFMAAFSIIETSTAASILLEENTELFPDAAKSHFICMVNLAYTYDVLVTSYHIAKDSLDGDSHKALELALTNFKALRDTIEFPVAYGVNFAAIIRRLNHLHGMDKVALADMEIYLHQTAAKP